MKWENFSTLAEPFHLADQIWELDCNVLDKVTVVYGR